MIDTIRLGGILYHASIRTDMIIALGPAPGGWARTCYLSDIGAWYVGSVAWDSFTLYPCVPFEGEFSHHARLEVQ